jgi:hypothetical protein
MFAVIALSALSALAAETSAPAWRLAPTAEEMETAYPDQARRDAIEGSSVLACQVVKSGALKDCVVEAEEPAGAGFGKASLRLQSHYKAILAGEDDPLLASEVKIPLRWRLPSTPMEPIAAKTPRLPAGRVELSCRLVQARRLENCWQVSEQPAGAGLGKAALEVVGKINAAANVEALPAATPVRVLVPIDFKPD